MSAQKAVEDTLSPDDVRPFHVALEYRVNCLPTFPQREESYINKIARETNEIFGLALKNMIIQQHFQLDGLASPTSSSSVTTPQTQNLGKLKSSLKLSSAESGDKHSIGTSDVTISNNQPKA